jgi:hypothetical protein
MTRKAIWATGGAVAAAIAILAGCNAVLGIDSASVDPAIGSDGQADTATGPATCDTYCAAIMQNCTGKNQEYIRKETCVAMCQHFEPGLAGDTTGDSFACRSYHAGAAAIDPDFHCHHAGPLGGGVCGTDPCAPYCLLDVALCNGMNPPPFMNGEIGCKSECPKFKYLTPADAGDITFTTGDTLNCRLYHLEAAYDPTNPTASTTHCPHTATVSAVCFDPSADGGSEGGGDAGPDADAATD